MQKRPADIDLSRQLADIVPPVRSERGDDAQPVRVGQRSEYRQELVAADHQDEDPVSCVRKILHMKGKTSKATML